MMLTIILGLLTAISYGFADFFAALGSRKVRVVYVSTVAAVSGLVLLLVLAPIMGADYSREAVLVGILGGIFSIGALISLYASLALGPISVISPLGAMVSAIFPIIIGTTWLGERFSGLGWLAIALALVAVWLVAFVPSKTAQVPSIRAVVLAVLAGIGIALSITALDQAPADSGIATVVVMRTTAFIGMALIALILLARRLKPRHDGSVGRLSPKIWLLMIGAGVFDALANVFFISAARLGTLSVVGVLTALYPLGTILLARLVLKEKISLSQAIGIALALGASALLALG